MTTELARMAEGLSRSPSTRNIGTTIELSQNVAARLTKTAVQVVEDGIAAKAADQDGQGEEEDESGAAEEGRRRV